MRPTSWRERAVLLAILIGSFAARWPFRSAPLIRDEGEYAQLGQAILNGATPYLEIYNQKTPAVFYGFAALQRLFGEAVETIRVATALYGLATTVLIWWLVRQRFGARAALVAALAFAVLTFDQGGIVHSASGEFFVLPWAVATLLLWYRGGWRSALAAGVCAGIAYQTKQSALVLPIFLVADTAWQWLRGRAAPLRDAGSALGGFALVTLLVLAFFASQGALDAYVECTWTNNFAYVAVRTVPVWAFLQGVATQLLWVDLGLWAFGAAGLAWLAFSDADPRASGLWILLVGTTGLALLGGNLSFHYFLPSIVPLAVGIGFLVEKAWTRFGRSAPLRIALLGAFVLPWLPPLREGFTRLRDPAATLESTFARLPPVTESVALAEYMAARTEPGEAILVIGSEPQVYFHADRPNASRMVFTYPMTGPYRFAADLRREFLSHLGPDGVRYVALVKHGASLSSWPAAARRFANEVEPHLRVHYEEEERLAVGPAREEILIVYRRKATS